MIKEELYSFDDGFRKEYGVVCGVDEAGRGPLAGPVCCASVVLKPDKRYDWLNDSKKLSEKHREELFEIIKQDAVSWHVELVDNSTIDRINILQATMHGMKKCIESLCFDVALIDGNKVPDSSLNCISVVKGDSKSASIAAASILAKVTRDNYMTEMAKIYPQYGFEKHKGYPTKAHYLAIRKYGPCEIHRMSFLKTLH